MKLFISALLVCGVAFAQALNPAGDFIATIATATTTATASSGSLSLTVASATGIQKYQAASGTGIAAGTIVTNVSGTTITISVATTTSLSSTSVTFGGLPSASANTNKHLLVIDGISGSDCSVGGGSAKASCVSNGTSWVALGGGGGVSMAYQLGDFLATTTSSVQTLGAGCSSSAPCNIRVGNAVLSVTAPITLTLGSGTLSDSIYWYATASGVFAGYNSANSYTCSGCTAAASTIAFPDPSIAGAVPLWLTTVASGTPATFSAITEAMDKRSVFSSIAITQGSGIGIVNNPSTGVDTISTDPNQVPRYFTGSGGPSGNCSAGRDFYTDTTGLNLYFCDAANTWKQANGGGPTLTGAQTWYPQFALLPPASLSGQTYTANTAYYVQLYTPVQVTVTNVAAFINTGVASTWGVVAWFNSSCSKISGSDATFSTASSGTYPTVTLGGTITIPAGIFYFGWAITNASVSMEAPNNIRSGGGFYQFASGGIGTALSFTGSNAPTGSGASTVMPASCGTKTANNGTDLPAIMTVQ